MDKVTSLILRQMRRPLIALILAYAISILGLVLIPGTDDQGNPWHMSFFHAFYFITYTATTIGFGEIPYPLNEAQRFWALACIYLSVVAWLYAIGKILSLIQDPAFRKANTEMRFIREVRRINEPFYLVCGYGDTGTSLLRAFSERNIRAVVIDNNENRINQLLLKDYSSSVPGICTDATLPQSLVNAGLQHKKCAGVLALTSSDPFNLKIAITSKLLSSHLPVVCRADTHDVNKNMASFGTDFIVDPFDTFADSLEMALYSPSIYLLYDWLTGVPNTLAEEPLYPPKGVWIICGFGRFGKAIYQRLTRYGITVRIIEQLPERAQCPDGCVVVQGRGTEAETLMQAGLEDAVAIVAGTDDDSNNLSILMTALEINPDLFLVARQNLSANHALFQAVHADMVMQPAEVISRKVRILLATPLVADLLDEVSNQYSSWANVLISRIAAVMGDILPHLWDIKINSQQAKGVFEALRLGRKVCIGHLLTDPRRSDHELACIPLLLVRNKRRLLTPDNDLELQENDQILFCGTPTIASSMTQTLLNLESVNYVMNGETGPDGYLWRWFYWHIKKHERRSLPRASS